MNANHPTTEKILAEALELHEKGVSLHSIVRTYPEHKTEIEELFSSMATLSLEKEKVRIPAGAFERMLAALPEIEPVTPKTSKAIKSPFAGIFAGLQVSSLRYVLPLAALALLTGGIVLQKDSSAPLAVSPTSDTVLTDHTSPAQSDTFALTSDTARSVTPPTAGPAAMMMKAAEPIANPTDRMVASFQEEAAYEATIAGRDDADTEKALDETAALTTDPTTSHEN